MPTEFIAALVQLGIAGIFIWYLQQDITRREEKHKAELAHLRAEKDELCTELATVRLQCETDKERLRNELTAQFKRRFADVNNYASTLWQINQSLRPILDFIQRERRPPRASRSDDSDVGS